MNRLTSAVLIAGAALMAPRTALTQTLRLDSDVDRRFASHIIISRCTLDVLIADTITTAHVLEEEHCGPLHVLAARPVVTPSGGREHPQSSHLFTIALMVTNAGPAVVTASTLVMAHDLRVIRRGRNVRPNGIALAPPDPAWPGGPPFVESSQGSTALWLLGTRDDAERLRLGPGEVSASARLTVGVATSIDGFRVSLTVLALRQEAAIPGAVPDVLPRWIDTLGRITHSDIAPTPYLRRLLLVRFPGSMSPEARQRSLDWVGAEVVGGIAAPRSEGVYLVSLPEAGEERDLELAMNALRNNDVRPGVFMPRDVVRQRTRVAPAAPARTTAYAWETHGTLTVRFAEDASLAERQEAAQMIGARVTTDYVGNYPESSVSLGENVPKDSLARAAERLARLWQVEGAYPEDTSMHTISSIGCRMPPFRPDTVSSVDPATRRWVRAAALPAQQAITEIVKLPAYDLVAFGVTYGPEQHVDLDGCFYHGAVGLRRGSHIGWLTPPESALVGHAVHDTFVIAATDRAMFTDAFARAVRDDELARTRNGWAQFWETELKPRILASSLIPPERLEELIRRLYIGSDSVYGSIAGQLLANPVVASDPRLLTLLAYIPNQREAVGSQALALSRILPRLMADSALPEATLFAAALFTWGNGWGDTLASHPGVMRSIPVLAVMASFYPRLRDSLYAHLHLPDDLSLDLQTLLPLPARPTPPIPRPSSGARPMTRMDSFRLYMSSQPPSPRDPEVLRDWIAGRRAFMASMTAFQNQRTARTDSMAIRWRNDPRVAADTQLLTVIANLSAPQLSLSDKLPGLIAWASRRLPESILRRNEPVDDPDILGLPPRRD